MRFDRGLVVVVGICFLAPLVACKNKDDAGKEKAPPSSKLVDKTTKEAPPEVKKEWTAEHSIAAFDALIAAMNSRDEKALAAAVAATIVDAGVDSVFSPTSKPKSNEEYVAGLKEFWDSFAPTMTPQLVIGSENHVLAILHVTGSGTDEVPIEVVRGKPLSILWVWYATFDSDGKLSAIESLNDESTFLHQSGWRPNEMSPDSEEKWATPVRAAAKSSAIEAANIKETKRLNALFQEKPLAAQKLSEAYAEKSMTRFAPIKKPFEFASREAKLEKLKSEIGSSETRYGKTDIWAAGDWVAVRVEATYVWPKGYPIADNKYDKKSAGKETSGTEFYFYRFEDGKIADSYGFWNDLHFQVQVGMFDPATLKQQKK